MFDSRAVRISEVPLYSTGICNIQKNLNRFSKKNFIKLNISDENKSNFDSFKKISGVKIGPQI